MSRAMHLVSVVACVPFLWIVTWVVLSPVLPSDRYPRGLALALAAAALVAGPAAVWLLDRAAPWLERNAVVRRTGLAGLLAGVFAVQVRTGVAVRFPPGWDAGIMEILAHGLAFDYLPPAQAVLSINQYPNNALLTAVLTRWLELWRWAGVDDPDLLFVLINAAVMCSSIGVAYGLARRIATPSAAYVTGLLAVALLTVSPWIGVAYSDTLGMIFPVTIAWLYVRLRATASRRGTAALWFAIALVGSLGYQVKPTGVFALGAAVAVSLIGLRWRTWTRGATAWRAVVAVSLAAGFLGGNAVGARVVEGVGITPTAGASEIALPVTHFMMMGAQSENLWGAYNGDDVSLTLSVPPGDERFDNGIRVYRERVGDMGPVGYAAFLHEKANWTLGDGSFFAFGEGAMSARPVPWASTDPLSRTIQRWMGPHGPHFGVVLAWWQSVWLAILALGAVPAVWWRRELFTAEATMLRVSLLGLLAFLLLFETRPRYLYLYLPCFIVLAALTLVATAGPARGLLRARRREPADHPAGGPVVAPGP